MSLISCLKKQHRVQLSLQRKQLSLQQRVAYSAEISDQLQTYLALLYPQHEDVQLLLYQSLPFEVDTSSLFRLLPYQIFAPRMLEGNLLEWVEVDEYSQWAEADFGVFEPVDGEVWRKSGKKVVLICPLLGFDDLGNRLGMGKGYFDRWLEKYAGQLEQQIGLAFSCQKLCKVPTEPHDAPLSVIVTELEVILCQAT
ncbi:MAG: 5-formyltetrahydrofolate cyclo-ligase [Ghiorsea sp.]